MANAVEFVPDQAKTEAVEAHVIWMTTGLGCDGDSVAMTSAVDPSLEDIVTQAIPGIQKVIVHKPVLAFENGSDVPCWRGRPRASAKSRWAAWGRSKQRAASPPTSGSTGWRPRPPRWSPWGHVRPTARSGDEEQPNQCDGTGQLPIGWKSSAGLRWLTFPVAPPSPTTRRKLLTWPCTSRGGSIADLDEAHRPTWLFGRTVRESCNRAGFAEQGEFATEYGSDHRCLVKLGCKGPVVKCNVPVRGWQSGVGGCPNVGGICMACTMPGFPDKYMPFMDEDTYGGLAATALS